MFLKFEDGETRDEFLSELAQQRPDLVEIVRVAKSQDQIVTVTTSDEARCREIEELAGGRAQLFGDVQFEPTLEDRGESG